MHATDSPRLIKARASHAASPAAPFNFEDLRRQCDEHIARTRAQAEQILQEAAAAAVEIRARAEAEGLAAGRQTALATADALVEARAAELAAEQMQAQVNTVLPALQAAVAQVEQERDRWLAHWETAAVELSAAMAEKILRRELARQPSLRTDLIREALQLAAGEQRLLVRLHPTDLAELQAGGTDTPGSLGSDSPAEFAADESITPGGCVVESRHGQLDARLETQLARMAEELLTGA